jgi:type 1 glutamine amidotransferase
MKIMRALLAVALLSLLSLPRPVAAGEPPAPTASPIRVLVMTGGHAFEKEPFFKLFQNNPDITYKAAEAPRDYALLRPDAAKNFDVLVLYTYNRPITEQAKADLVACLEAGKGLVILHHAIATYPDWPEYWKILGARYYLKSNVVDGVFKPRSAWKEGVPIKVHIADANHPVTHGLQDFEIHDETYKLFDVSKDCHPLLSTEQPLSNPVIAWSKTYAKARVVYIQSGHDHTAYENPNYVQLLRQALRWTAGKD